VSEPRKILVTGAAGFIGFHLARALLARGEHVVGLDNLNDYYSVQLKQDRLAQLTGDPNFRFVHIDCADRAAMHKLFSEEEFPRVVHLAAQAGVRYSLTNPNAYVDSNLVGFMNILEGCRHAGVGHLLYASSSSTTSVTNSTIRGNRAMGTGGGVYLFEDDASALAYADEQTARLEGFGITDIRAKLFHVNEPLTAINGGPV
jgi:nucleoside-diphosphate-sugar epimerase